MKLKQNLFENEIKSQADRVERFPQEIAKGKDLWHCFRRVPNVIKFQVEISTWDSILLKLGGVRKRLEPKYTYEKHSNNACNRYMEHQLRRMSNANPTLFWTISCSLIRRSNVFFLMALNHVYPRWHRDYKLSKIIALAESVRRTASSLDVKLDVRRVYIPKAEVSDVQ